MAATKFVITGGPCTGKTTTLEALRKKGFRVLEEASRLLIEEQNKNGGDLVPWKKLYDFNAAVTELQIKMESEATTGAYFLDRGVIDNLAYCEWGGIDPPENLKAAATKIKYEKVFLLLPLKIFENDTVRKENKNDAVKLTKLIKKVYQKLGHEVIEVPPFSVEKRVEFILEKL